MATAGGGAHVEIDFRSFINKMRRVEDSVLESINTPGLKEQIFADIAGSLLDAKGRDTGATEASIDAVASGESISNVAYVSEKGVTRYANASIITKGDYQGIHIDPVDSHGRPYGAFSVDGWQDVNEYRIYSDVYDEIYDIILEYVKKE